MSKNDKSFFAKTMQLHEIGLLHHQETDDYMKSQKREILLNILKSIRENPPNFLNENMNNHSIGELDDYIQKLEKISTK